MSRFSAVCRYRRQIADFVVSKRGNVATQFAIALIPIVCFVGMAIDYGRAARARSAMQSAIDSTALILSRDLSQGKLQIADIPKKAQTYFAGLYANRDAQGVAITATYAPANAVSSATVLLNGSGYVECDFMQLAGYSTLSFQTTATTTWGSAHMLVALALDNTGSMSSSNKMTSLQQAVAGTNGLIDQLSALARNPGDVYISLVPFTSVVNVGDSVSTDVIDFTDWEAAPVGASNAVTQPNTRRGYVAKLPTSWSSIGPGSQCPFVSGAQNLYNNFPGSSSSAIGFNCVNGATGTTSADYLATIASDGMICPGWDAWSHSYYNGCWNSVATGTGSYNHTWIPQPRSTWSGCVTDRSSPNDVTGVPPTSSDPTTLFPAIEDSPQYDDIQNSARTGYDNNSPLPANSKGVNWNNSCSKNRGKQAAPQLAPVVPLTSDWNSLKAAVNVMQPVGNTNQAIGMAWAWQSLIPGGPLPVPSEAAADTYNRVIIILSDGLNTQSRWGDESNGMWTYEPKGTGSNAIDVRQTKLCTNIKNAKGADGQAMYTVYTIQVNTDGDPVSTVLKNCASTPDKFFVLTNASQIANTFTQIGTALSKLRLSN